MKTLLWKKIKIAFVNISLLAAIAVVLLIGTFVFIRLTTALGLGLEVLLVAFIAVLVLLAQLLRKISVFKNTRLFTKVIYFLILSILIELSVHIPLLLYLDYAHSVKELYENLMTDQHYILNFSLTTLGVLLGSYFLFFLVDKTLSWIQKRKTK